MSSNEETKSSWELIKSIFSDSSTSFMYKLAQLGDILGNLTLLNKLYGGHKNLILIACFIIIGYMFMTFVYKSAFGGKTSMAMGMMSQPMAQQFAPMAQQYAPMAQQYAPMAQKLMQPMMRR